MMQQSPSIEQAQPSDLDLSPTLRSVEGELGTKGPVSAVAVVNNILSKHREYGRNMAASLTLYEPDTKQPGTMRTIQEWLEEVRTLFDPSRVPKLHGRMMILGLSFLDGDVRSQLEGNDFLEMLEVELRGSLDEMLTPRGRALRETSDSVPIHSDDAVNDIKKDKLGRDAFARFLGARIGAITDQERAYSIHLYGPWGVGKTTVLNFLRADLEKENKWRVVDFNAWQHQHIRPPWWSLMDRIYQECKKDLRPWHRFQESSWRISLGRLPHVVAAVALLWLFALAFLIFQDDISSMNQGMKEWAALAENLSQVLALLGTIGAVFLAASRSMIPSSARAAQTYQDLVSDPMNKIVRRFNQLINRVKPKRVAVFVDDLDRCQSSYVIELLEGIQTLFREAPVVFVIVADRRWINACFEDVYKTLTPWVHEPGKPLGTLFLEKAFQFSTSVPGIAASVRETYWRDLLSLTPNEAASELDRAQREADIEMAGLGFEAAIVGAVQRSRFRSPIEKRAYREAAVIRLAAPEVMARTENTLAEFGPLLEPNPRTMKRLVNTYSVNRALALLSEVDIEREVLARWTILTMRWPRLAEYLEENPEMVDNIGPQNVSIVPKELQALFDDEDVIKVVNGDTAADSINVETVRSCARLHA